MDAGYMHEFDPNRAAFCKQIVNGRHCGLSDTADVHTRYETSKPKPPFLDFEVTMPDVYADDFEFFTLTVHPHYMHASPEEMRQFVEDAIREKLERL